MYLINIRVIRILIARCSSRASYTACCPSFLILLLSTLVITTNQTFPFLRITQRFVSRDGHVQTTHPPFQISFLFSLLFLHLLYTGIALSSSLVSSFSLST